MSTFGGENEREAAQQAVGGQGVGRQPIPGGQGEESCWGVSWGDMGPWGWGRDLGARLAGGGGKGKLWLAGLEAGMHWGRGGGRCSRSCVWVESLLTCSAGWVSGQLPSRAGFLRLLCQERRFQSWGSRAALGIRVAKHLGEE